ncbi:MAG: hypothetical protein SF162_15770 [bacterium]|nr:hypothetical protein [bacterium]
MSLPSNETLLAFSTDVPWAEIERQKRQFNRALETLIEQAHPGALPLDDMADAVGVPLSAHHDQADDAALERGNIILAHQNGRAYVMGSTVSARYRGDHTFADSIVPYNLNPSVNHTNIQETEDPLTRMRVIGAELELGVVHGDGAPPTEADVQEYIKAYYVHASRIGIYPRLDREACQYQVEAHIAPSVGYQKTRTALNGMFAALAAASQDTGLITAIMSCYPTESDFKMTDHPKVQTAVDLMLEVNELFPEYRQRLEERRARYHIDDSAHYVNLFRNQGCHIHIDLAGRSEALGLLTFYTVLRSATAIANAAVLKGGPFVNGTCDPELLCAREYLRGATVTGRYLQVPTSPHLTENGLAQYADLIDHERANAVGRAMLYDDRMGIPISVMHNPIGRVRPDLHTIRRVCTVESTGMPANVSASRMAAVLTDFEFSHAVIEQYFRKYGCDLNPMYEDKTLLAILGPLQEVDYIAQQDNSDREGSEIVVTTAAGTTMPLAEFYEMKRRYMHRALADLNEVAPRDIDEVYTSLNRMLEPLSGQAAQTIEQYVTDPKLRSTGNWGKILRDAFLEAGGVLGKHQPDIVLQVVNRVHEAMRVRYLN